MKILKFQILIALSACLLFAVTASAQPIEIEGVAADDRFGLSNDCHADKVLVGVPGKDNGGDADVGEVRIYRGNGQLSSTIPFYSSPLGGEHFGYAVSFVGDVDGDNGTDFIVGSPGETSTGAVHVYSTADTSFPYFSHYGVEAGAEYGLSVAALEDLTSDGLAEIAVGAPQTNGSGTDDGLVEVLDPNSGTPVLHTFTGSNNEEFGFSLAPGGNINGSTASLLIGAPKGNSGLGRVYLYDLITGSQLSFIDGLQPGNNFGHSVERVSDVDGDGVDEVLVGSPRFGQNNPGSAFLYSGASVLAGNPVALCNLFEGEAGSLYGGSVRFLGDINGDGAADFAVGSRNSDDIGFNATTSHQGAIYIYTFRSDITACPLIGGVGGFEQVGKEFGTSISGGPSCNFNADPFNDFVVGTLSDTNGTDAGSIALYDGSEFNTGPSLSRVKLKFKISRTGQFAGIIDVNADPVPRACRATILGRAQQGNVIGSVFHLGSADLQGLENNIIVNTKLPKSLIIDGQKPILHLIARVDCIGRSTHYSNVFARYMNCSCEADLNAGEWVREFQRKAGNFDLRNNSRTSIQASTKVKRMLRKLRRKKKKKKRKKRK